MKRVQEGAVLERLEGFRLSPRQRHQWLASGLQLVAELLRDLLQEAAANTSEIVPSE
jgi:hypothetical protein